MAGRGQAEGCEDEWRGVSMLAPYCPLSEGVPSDCCHTAPSSTWRGLWAPCGPGCLGCGSRGLQSCGWGQIAKGQEPRGDEGHSSSLTGGF